MDEIVFFIDDFLSTKDSQTLLEKSNEELLNRTPIKDKDTNGALDNESEIYRIDPTMGRCLVEIFDVTQDIKDKLTRMIRNKFGNYIFQSATFCEYNKKYGTPSLVSHMDGSDDVICIDYQLDSNTDWPIKIDEELVTLKNNQVLIFNSGKVNHGRVEKDFEDGEYIKMVFFFFKKEKELTVLENIFNQEEINEINNEIDNQLTLRKEIDYHESYHYEGDDSSSFVRLHKDIGRKIIEYFEIPNDIILKLTNLVEQSYPNYKYSTATICEYSLKHGIPSLPPHFDAAKTSYLLLDYQLESNTVWPLIVENSTDSFKSFSLKDNDGHIMFPKRDLHGRVEKVFNEGEYVKMIFFYFEEK